MPEREAKVYWIKRTGQKDLLVFDAGHEGGTVYIYEFKEGVLSDDIQKETTDVKLWIEKKYGLPANAWKLMQNW